MKKYKWMEECIVIDGYLRSCIYDLSRQKTYFVDNNTKALIQKIESLGAGCIEENLSDDELEWFHFFIDKEFLFKVPNNQMQYFKKMAIDWYDPSKIMNVIIENSNHITKILKFLNKLNCHHIIIIFQNPHEILKVLNQHFKKTFLKSLDIIVENNEFNSDYYESLLSNFPVLSDIYLKELSEKKYADNIIKINPINSKKITFTVEIKLFMESHFHNVYYNRKLFFNKNGDFYNTPESNLKLGNITNVTSAEKLLKLAKIKEWDSKKDNTYVCEDCELRNMCVDNRAPKWKEQDKKWYYETECDYNPYIGLWKEEDNYMTLKKCGIKIKNKNLEIDKQKLDSINKNIWN